MRNTKASLLAAAVAAMTFAESSMFEPARFGPTTSPPTKPGGKSSHKQQARKQRRKK